MHEMEIAKRAARAGGDVARHYYNAGVEMESKAGEGTYNLVSRADREAERAIVEVIREAFPSHKVLGEEENEVADLSTEHLWIVDPIDGTNNFAHHMPHFAVSIAYWHHGRPACGVVYNPIRDDWFEAIRGQGATANGEPAHVGEQSKLDEVFVGLGFYYDRGAMMEATLDAMREFFGAHVHGIRRFGTASLDLCFVGTGAYAAYFEYELSPWDFAAGQLFVEEAGGTVTTARGEPLPLGKSSLLASNTKLHDAALQIVAKHHP
ncbi:inositol monophosphatase family protein [Thalassoroseus pseudoceratinae]|uniref:inositol monophosphatase family protein n=1 Tax=Thalassoroseus pseudoceratinae TaxID=2713176 RepID=UPI00142170E9|nr:inositol monophosphatase family protein [Thalassoroseus pseudoceratinae]